MIRVSDYCRSPFIGILLLGLSACSPLEPILIEPEMSDLQLTVDTLMASLREAQRTVAELRTEVDARRQELADVQIARAQLDGRIREAERRLTEAWHVIDLQREELVSARSEQGRAGQTRAALQHQPKPFQKQVSQLEKQMKGNVFHADMVSSRDGQVKVEAGASQQEALLAAWSQSVTVPPRSHVMVKSGDTLWSIAHRYHTSVKRLMDFNALPSDHIQVGQSLWLY